MNIIKKIKWFFQRARTGYAYIDHISFFHYVANIMVKGLRDLRDKGEGYPAQLTREEWQAKLTRWINAFESAREEWNWGYTHLKDGQYTEGKVKEEMEEGSRLYEEKHKKFIEDLKDIWEWYFYLWR